MSCSVKKGCWGVHPTDWRVIYNNGNPSQRLSSSMQLAKLARSSDNVVLQDIVNQEWKVPALNNMRPADLKYSEYNPVGTDVYEPQIFAAPARYRAYDPRGVPDPSVWSKVRLDSFGQYDVEWKNLQPQYETFGGNPMCATCSSVFDNNPLYAKTPNALNREIYNPSIMRKISNWWNAKMKY